MTDLITRGSAVISDCALYRWLLDRILGSTGIVFAYFGVNGSTANGTEDDPTVMKWNGFTVRNGGSRYIVGNAFGLRGRDVKKLAAAADPIGPLNDFYLAEIIAEADVLVPCWGSRFKLPLRLRPRLTEMEAMIFAAEKPVRVFGFTDAGDPLHPLMLPYTTPLKEWRAE
jgi:hypothetical protein